MLFDRKIQQVYLLREFEQQSRIEDENVIYESNCLYVSSFKSPYGSMQRDNLRIFEIRLIVRSGRVKCSIIAYDNKDCLIHSNDVIHTLLIICFLFFFLAIRARFLYPCVVVCMLLHKDIGSGLYHCMGHSFASVSTDGRYTYLYCIWFYF